MIHTAAMSSRKKTFDLASGLRTLDVFLASGMKRSTGGEGIGGLRIPPQEIVPCDPEDPAAGRATLIERAAALVSRYPQGRVPCDPRKHGWRR